MDIRVLLAVYAISANSKYSKKLRKEQWGKFGLYFLLETYNQTTIISKINR